MLDPTSWDMIVKLVAALLLGGLIGLERETHGRPAGLRTHILVCLGSTLFTLCSYAMAGTMFDPARVTAQIVTGIGFLGAGTIMRQGSVVRGLTTAASVWTVAAIGIAVAIGGHMFYVAMAATLLTVGTLNLVPQIEHYLLLKQGDKQLTAVVKIEGNAASDLLAILAKNGINLRTLSTEESADPAVQVLKIRGKVGRVFDEVALGAELIACDGVISYSWE